MSDQEARENPQTTTEVVLALVEDLCARLAQVEAENATLREANATLQRTVDEHAFTLSALRTVNRFAFLPAPPSPDTEDH